NLRIEHLRRVIAEDEQLPRCLLHRDRAIAWHILVRHVERGHQAGEIARRAAERCVAAIEDVLIHRSAACIEPTAPAARETTSESKQCSRAMRWSGNRAGRPRSSTQASSGL